MSSMEALLRKYDTNNFHVEFLNFGNKLIDQYKNLVKIELPKEYSNPRIILFSGMGGSGVVGDVIRDYIYYSNYKHKLNGIILVNKSHLLPEYINDEDLLVAISYSGNTAETLSVVLDAIRKGVNTICITSDGKLEVICSEKGVPCVKINKAMAPRSALPELIAASLRIIEIISGLNFEEEIKETRDYLNDKKNDWSPKNSSEPLKLAKKCINKIPVIYVPENLKSVGIRAKTAFNENSKVNAYYDVFPELFHNEVMAYDHDINSNIIPIFVGGNSKLERFYEYLTKRNCRVVSIEEPTDVGRLAAILSLIMYFDLTSIYLAVLRKVDPYPVKLISWLKKYG